MEKTPTDNVVDFKVHRERKEQEKRDKVHKALLARAKKLDW